MFLREANSGLPQKVEVVENYNGGQNWPPSKTNAFGI